MKRILPITVTTYEALCICVEQRVELIYVTFELWEEEKDRIWQTLKKHRYRLAKLPARNGWFYIRGFRFRKYYISDPYHVY